jgi:hypothetical protein
VAGLLDPLAMALSRCQQLDCVGSKAIAEWTEFVVSTVCQRFLVAATEVVSSAKKTAAGLDLIKSRRKKSPNSSTGGDDAAVLSDTEKICVQLWLDMQAFEVQALQKLSHRGRLDNADDANSASSADLMAAERTMHGVCEPFRSWIESELSSNALITVAKLRNM